MENFRIYIYRLYWSPQPIHCYLYEGTFGKCPRLKLLKITFTFVENISIYHNHPSLIVPAKTPVMIKNDVTVSIYPQIVISRRYWRHYFPHCVSFLFQRFSDACNFIKNDTLAQLFPCEFYEIFKNTFFHRTPPMAASVFKIMNLTLVQWCSIEWLFWEFLQDLVKSTHDDIFFGKVVGLDLLTAFYSSSGRIVLFASVV